MTPLLDYEVLPLLTLVLVFLALLLYVRRLSGPVRTPPTTQSAHLGAYAEALTLLKQSRPNYRGVVQQICEDVEEAALMLRRGPSPAQREAPQPIRNFLEQCSRVMGNEFVGEEKFLEVKRRYLDVKQEMEAGGSSGFENLH